ncbi:MAG: signal peptidase II [Nitrospirae bacterium]|nr:signal peptidase II [Nitrospirota bacterium]
MGPGKALFIASIAAVVVVLDFITKKLIMLYVNPYEAVDILPFLRIVNVKNMGAAFGLFSNLGNNVFISIYVIAIIIITLYCLSIPKGIELFALALILGGSIGNLIDRLTIGKVIDFIDFFINRWHWPAFNVADSALTAGMVLLLWVNIKSLKIKNQN